MPSMNGEVSRLPAVATSMVAKSPDISKVSKSFDGLTLDRLQAVIVNVDTAKKAVSTRAFCAVATVLTGIINMFTHPILGVMCAGVGTVELCRIFGGNTNDFQSLLSDTSAGLQLLQALDAKNQASLTTLNRDLEQVKGHIGDLSKKLEAVQNIATEGNADLEILKTEAEKEYKQALELQSQVLAKLLSAHDKLEEGREVLNRCAQCMDDMSQRASKPVYRNEAIDVLNAFQKQAQDTCDQFLEAQHVLAAADNELAETITLFQQSNAQNERAVEAATAAIVTAQERLRAAAEAAEAEAALAQLRGLTDAMAGEIEVMQERVEEQRQIAADAQANVDQARGQIQIGMQSLIIGGGLGTLAGLAFGGVAPVVTGPAGALAYHNRRRIQSAVGIKPKSLPTPSAVANHVRFTFDASSSGWGGWIKGRSSSTVGTIEFTFGGIGYRFRIDLNKEKPLSVENMVKLREELTVRAQRNPDLADEAESIVQELKTLEIDRGARGMMRGVIAESSPYFGVDFARSMEQARA